MIECSMSNYSKKRISVNHAFKLYLTDHNLTAPSLSIEESALSQGTAFLDTPLLVVRDIRLVVHELISNTRWSSPSFEHNSNSQLEASVSQITGASLLQDQASSQISTPSTWKRVEMISATKRNEQGSSTQVSETCVSRSCPSLPSFLRQLLFVPQKLQFTRLGYSVSCSGTTPTSFETLENRLNCRFFCEIPQPNDSRIPSC